MSEIYAFLALNKIELLIKNRRKYEVLERNGKVFHYRFEDTFDTLKLVDKSLLVTSDFRTLIEKIGTLDMQIAFSYIRLAHNQGEDDILDQCSKLRINELSILPNELQINRWYKLPTQR